MELPVSLAQPQTSVDNITICRMQSLVHVLKRTAEQGWQDCEIMGCCHCWCCPSKTSVFCHLCAMPAECRNCRPLRKGCRTRDTVTRSVSRPLLLSMKDHKSPWPANSCSTRHVTQMEQQRCALQVMQSVRGRWCVRTICSSNRCNMCLAQLCLGGDSWVGAGTFWVVGLESGRPWFRTCTSTTLPASCQAACRLMMFSCCRPMCNRTCSAPAAKAHTRP